jgi:hypothetical protein
LAQIPELEHCLPRNIAMYNGKKTIFIGNFKTAFRGFVDELTEEQRRCYFATFDSGSCEVKKAMLACKNVVGKGECVAQIPELVQCFN